MRPKPHGSSISPLAGPSHSATSTPFDDLSSSKVRPAICLTDPIGPYRHVILAFITSRVPATSLATDLVLDAGYPDLYPE